MCTFSGVKEWNGITRGVTFSAVDGTRETSSERVPRCRVKNKPGKGESKGGFVTRAGSKGGEGGALEPNGASTSWWRLES